MALERSRHRGRVTGKIRLTARPLCGHEFGYKDARWKHLLDEHGPKDAGLSPIGESPRDVDRPLFEIEEGSA